MKQSASFILILILSISCFFCSSQTITTIAGVWYPGFTGDGGSAATASLYGPYGLAVDDTGNLYISTSGGPTPALNRSKVRKVNTSGIISTFAGVDTVGFSGDSGPATSARLFDPYGIAFDKKGNVYIADLYVNGRVRKVDPSGIITTFAGDGSATPSGDGGPATAAGLGTGAGICTDPIGNVYIAAGNKIRKVDTAGIISTFAGVGPGFYSGDGGPATAAAMTAQGQIALDNSGNMFIAEGSGYRIRRINPAGIITTIAGNGVSGYSGDGGAATAAQIGNVIGVFPDNCGNVYIADRNNNRIRRINNHGIITTVAGNGIAGFGGDSGPASAAQLKSPNFIYLDKTGSIYISDQGNARVRYIHMDSCRNTTEAPSVAASEEVLRVFPNPNNGTCGITLSTAINEPAEIVITNILGMVVQQAATTTNKEIEVRLDVPAGMYFVSMRTKERWYNAKMVVQ